jgi:hypothetical protein
VKITPQLCIHITLCGYITLTPTHKNGPDHTLTKGEPTTPEQMQALIERADKDKMRRALERLGESRLTAPSGAGTTEEMER